jgi:DNA primase
MASQSVVEEIKQKVDIVELVGSYVSLKHAGKYFKANCPFHQEKTPSFVVSPDIQRWHCFGACHEGGDIFNFIMKWEGVSFGEALRILAERAGVPLTDQAKSSGYFDAEVDKRSKVFSINELAAKYYAYLLQTAESATVARAYLTERTLPEAIVKTFQIGYAPEAWTNLRDYMYKKNFQDQDLLATGLFVQGERGIYDRFRGRLMFPIQNTRGQVVGFSGRLIKEDISEKDGGKYINTPETLVYHKRESLYGFYHTKDEVRKSNTAIVVEGEFDMLTPYTKGITNIVAIKGSAFTEEQLKTLRRYCNRLILALDNDPAGFDALRKSTLDAQQFSFELYVCAIPEGKDPDEAARMNIGALKAAIRQPIPVYDHIINTLFTRVDENDPFSKKHFIEGAIPFIDMIENPIVRTHYIQKAAGLLKSSEDAVITMLRDYKRKGRKPVTRVTDDVDNNIPKHQERVDALAKRILSVLLAVPLDTTVMHEILAILSPNDFLTPAYRVLYERFQGYMTNHPKFDTDQFIADLSPELRPLYDELYLYASTADQSDDKYLLRLALEYKKMHIAQTIQSLSKESEKDTDEQVGKLNADMVAVEKRLKLL